MSNKSGHQIFKTKKLVRTYSEAQQNIDENKQIKRGGHKIYLKLIKLSSAILEVNPQKGETQAPVLPAAKLLTSASENGEKKRCWQRGRDGGISNREMKTTPPHFYH